MASCMALDSIQHGEVLDVKVPSVAPFLVPQQRSSPQPTLRHASFDKLGRVIIISHWGMMPTVHTLSHSPRRVVDKGTS